MKLIVGLGNPGEKYEKTRHNVGFMAVDYILNDGDDFMREKPSHDFKSEVHTIEMNGKKIIFLKPQTYMNDSGQALRVICNFYKLDLKKDLLIIHDEVDLPFGEIRVTDSSSSAGHNGVQSLIDNLGTQDFHRVRVGIETRASRTETSTDAFVLQNFTEDELSKVRKELLPKVEEEVKKFISA